MAGSIGLKVAVALCVLAVIFVPFVSAVKSADGPSGQTGARSISISSVDVHEAVAEKADPDQQVILRVGFEDNSFLDANTAIDDIDSLPAQVVLQGNSPQAARAYTEEDNGEGPGAPITEDDGFEVRGGIPFALRALRLKSDYQKAQARALRMKAHAKTMEAEAAIAGAAEQQSLMVKSRELFATGEAAELNAKADFLEGQAKLLDHRSGSSQDVESAGGSGQRPQMSIFGPPGGRKLLRTGDTVRFEVIPDPDWGIQRATVSEDGTITLPHIGRVRAVGKTFVEVGREVFGKYKEWKRGLAPSLPK